VLPPDVEFEKLSWSPKELMLLELRSFDTRAITAAFGVPSMLLNESVTGGLVYQNPVSLFDFWWRSELRATALKFERAMSARFLPRPQTMRLDPGTLLTPPFAEFNQVMVAAYQAGVVNADEWRIHGLALPELPDGAGAEIATGAPKLSAVEAVQKVYLGVGKVITAEEARRMLIDAGADLAAVTPPELTQAPTALPQGGTTP
jgi:hypothetical protein